MFYNLQLLTFVTCSLKVSPSTDWVVGGEGGEGRDDSAEILFQSFLQEAIVSSSGVTRGKHSLLDARLTLHAEPSLTDSPHAKSALQDFTRSKFRLRMFNSQTAAPLPPPPTPPPPVPEIMSLTGQLN